MSIVGHKEITTTILLLAPVITIGVLVHRLWKSTSNSQNRSVIEDRAIGMLLGIGIGDAKGIPYENSTLKELREKKVHQNTEIYSKCDITHPFLPNYGPGVWTDDTQLSMAMARALAKYGKVDWNGIVDEHVVEWKKSVAGWGYTQYAIERLARKSHDYKNCGNNNSIGNGVIMKICPLAFFYAHRNDISEDQKWEEIVTLTKMTHNTPSAIVTSLLFTKIVEILYRNTTFLDKTDSRKEFLAQVIHIASDIEAKVFLENDIPLEDDRNNPILLNYNKSVTHITPYLQRIYSEFGSGEFSDEKLEELTLGGTFFCVSSLLMVIGILIAAKPSHQQILRAALIGGDTDSNASMVGGIIGGMKGTQILQSEYITNLKGHHLLEKIGKDLATSLVNK